MKNVEIEAERKAFGEQIFEGNFGLEKESLRTDERGYLAHTEHPFPGNPNIDRDFCENQVEIITDVCGSVEEVYAQLSKLHKTVVRKLAGLESGAEYLWTFSNPPYVRGEADIPIASYAGTLKGKEIYRKYLAQKYGKKKMLFSGIHFNFSFSEEMLEKGCQLENAPSVQAYKNKLYLHLAKEITKYSWLIVYLTAASPLMDGSFFKDEAIGKDVLSGYSSARCSEIGYWNDFIPILDYENLDSYVKSIQSYVDSGQLRAATELYYPVRLKPRGENTLDCLKEKGVNHIELRMLDLNPFSPVGIQKEDLEFLHYLIIYLAFQADEAFETYEQIMAVKNEKRAAKYEEKEIWIETGWSKSVLVRDAVMEFLGNMEQFYEPFGKERVMRSISYQKDKIVYPERRYTVRVKKEFRQNYVEHGLELVKKYAEEIIREEEDRQNV